MSIWIRILDPEPDKILFFKVGVGVRGSGEGRGGGEQGKGGERVGGREDEDEDENKEEDEEYYE